MDHFTTISQYDDKFKNNNNFGSDRSACTFFALITAYMFMEDYDMTEERHINNVEKGVETYIKSGINNNLTFDSLLAYTDSYSESNVQVTSCELLKSNIIGYDHILQENKEPYCVIFLKNTNYFVVLVRDGVYCLRNCHEKDQYVFWTLDELTNHLNTVYQFNQEIDLDGYKIPEFSNIEFLIVNKKFKIPLLDIHEVDDEKLALQLQEEEYTNQNNI